MNVLQAIEKLNDYDFKISALNRILSRIDKDRDFTSETGALQIKQEL